MSGTIDDNPLSNSATTLNSTELAGLEAIDSTEHAVLVLDPTGAGNGPEVVYVTAHTGSATSATVVRGREGTSGVQHSSVMTWVHVPTIHDYIQSLTSSTRPSTGGIPYAGQMIYETNTDKLMQYTTSTTGWNPPWNLPWGIVALVEVTSSQSSINTITDLTSLTSTNTFVANRRIRITGYLPNAGSTTSAVFWELTIADGSNTVLQKGVQATVSASQPAVVIAQKVLTTSAGSATYKLRGTTGTAGGYHTASATAPSFLLIEDIGPAAAPS